MSFLIDGFGNLWNIFINGIQKDFITTICAIILGLLITRPLLKIGKGFDKFDKLDKSIVLATTISFTVYIYKMIAVIVVEALNNEVGFIAEINSSETMYSYLWFTVIAIVVVYLILTKGKIKKIK